VNEQQRYPLSWPTGWARTPRNHRQRANFRQTTEGVEQRRGTDGVVRNVAVKRDREVSLFAATERLDRQLQLLGATLATLSSNVVLRLDGRPRSGQPEPDDVGVACYFTLRGKAVVLACDRWNRVADNVAAIAAHIDALRRIDRYGVGTVDQVFLGYAALAANTAANWRDVFGFPDGTRPTLAAVDEKFKTLARAAHPDSGGTHDQMARLSEARAFARQELSA
jgi:hypothetical protein